METKTIHAFTEVGVEYPAFINIAATRGNDKIFVTVRERGTNTFVRVEMTQEQIEALAADIFNHFNRAMNETQLHALKTLIALARAAFHAMADSEELEGGRVLVEPDHADLICSALNDLDALPDDQPGYTMNGPMRAEWALRDLLTSNNQVEGAEGCLQPQAPSRTPGSA